MMGAVALVEVMHDYLDVYDALLNLARRKQRILLHGRPAELEAVVRAEETLLGRLPSIDRRLGEAMHAFSPPGEDEPARLTAVLQNLNEPERSQVEAIGTRLRAVLEELRRIGAENVVLLRRALQFVQFTIRLVERATAEATYSATGDVAGYTREPVVDRRA